MNDSKPLNLLINTLVEKSKNQFASNSNFESTFARANLHVDHLQQHQRAWAHRKQPQKHSIPREIRRRRFQSRVRERSDMYQWSFKGGFKLFPAPRAKASAFEACGLVLAHPAPARNLFTLFKVC
jgi:hypothetical protein